MYLTLLYEKHDEISDNVVPVSQLIQFDDNILHMPKYLEHLTCDASLHTNHATFTLEIFRRIAKNSYHVNIDNIIY